MLNIIQILVGCIYVQICKQFSIVNFTFYFQNTTKVQAIKQGPWKQLFFQGLKTVMVINY